jgi:hypothetical protein
MARLCARRKRKKGRGTVHALSADEICDQIASELPQRGDDVLAALEALQADLAEFVAASVAYNACVRESVELLRARGWSSPRASLDQWHPPTVDGLHLKEIKPHGQLAALVAPAMDALKAPHFVGSDLRVLSESVPAMVTSRQIAINRID